LYFLKSDFTIIEISLHNTEYEFPLLFCNFPLFQKSSFKNRTFK
jgi:hypothetical protein